MSEVLADSAFFGVLISISSYGLGVALKKKFKLAVFNPLLISIIITMAVIMILNVDYEAYNAGAQYLSWFLTPATVALAVPLYEQLRLLRKNFAAIILGIISGVVTSLTSVFLMALAFGLSHKEYVTLLPKSITTAIGMGISEELGGYITISVAVIVITGVLGNIIAPLVCKLFRIINPVAKGIAIGSASHAVGTTKAMEMGEVEGAMSSLSIAVSGILTVGGASIFAQFI